MAGQVEQREVCIKKVTFPEKRLTGAVFLDVAKTFNTV
jgi:hypothetical protein